MNWTALTTGDLRDSGHTAIVDSAEAMTPGCSDRIIADVVATIRGSISSGNQLDQDASKIPNSLKARAARSVLRQLKVKVNFPLKPEDGTDDDDNKYFDRISKSKTRFESPDNPGGSAEMQPGAGMIDEAQPGNCGNSREELKRL